MARLSNWISVNDKPIKDGSMVVVYAPGYEPVIVHEWDSKYPSQDYSMCCGCSIPTDDITHWMPLPEPPKE